MPRPTSSPTSCAGTAAAIAGGTPVSAADVLARAVAPSALAALLDGDALEVPRRALDAALLDPTLRFVARPGKALRARLVALGWRLGGGTGPVPAALPTLIELIHAGSLIVDDIEDGSPERRGEPALHRRIGVPLALNAGNWLYFVPLQLLADLALPPATELALHRAMTGAMARCHLGQALDLGVRVGELPQAEVAATVRFVTTCKTGALTELGLVVGALAAGADDARRRALGRFGRRFGVALQMLDDLANVGARNDDARRFEDVRLGRPTWPWAWLAERLPPVRFGRLQRAARAVADGRLAPETLGTRLAALSDAAGRRAARASLAQALASLRRALGDAAELDALGAEVERLLVSYG